jgi:hypothetical protein
VRESAVRTFAIVAGIAIVMVVGWDAFETVLLPRRVVRRLRLSGMFLGNLWRTWAWVGKRVPERLCETYLSLYALLGLLMLFALWAGAVIAGYALVDVGLSHGFTFPHGVSGYGGDLYVSGTTFFTLGLGDVVPASTAARALTVLEAGSGLVFLALVISYLPVLYQAFSRRELEISVLDEWAGTPPNGVELLRRAGQDGSLESVTTVLTEWEHWAADVLESHVSFPILAFFRSQHENQSWLSALTAILDLSVLGVLGVPGVNRAQSRRTFAMARHAVVDLSQVLNAPPDKPVPPMAGRSDVRLADIAVMLRQAGVGIEVNVIKEQHLANMRRAYEPYVEALSRRLMMPLPTLAPNEDARDNWVRSPWEA